MERPARVALLVVSAIAVSYLLEQTRVRSEQPAAQAVVKPSVAVVDHKEAVAPVMEKDAVVVEEKDAAVVVAVSEEPTSVDVGELLVSSVVVVEVEAVVPPNTRNDEDLVREIVNEAIAQVEVEAEEETETECFSKRFPLHPQDDDNNGEKEEVEIFFFILPLDQSCFVWCGADSTELTSLVVAMKPQRNQTASATAVLTNHSSSDQDLASAARLARKANQVVHFASSLSSVEAAHPEVRLWAEKEILTRI